MKRTIRSIAAVASLLVAAGAAAESIEFLHHVEAARVLALGDGKPIVLQFGATWCGWCRKMEYETFLDEHVLAAAAGFHWVKVDIDAQPTIAASYGVRGVPRTVVIDATGEPLADHGGFLDAPRLVDLLLSASASALESEAGRAARTPPGAAETTRRFVEALSRPRRQGREELLVAIRALEGEAWPVLLKLMDDRRLAIRAAAGQALAFCVRADLRFDPFAAPARRAEQLAAWRGWVARLTQARDNPPTRPGQ